MSEPTNKPVLDLATLDQQGPAEKGATLSLLHPVTGEELGIAIQVLGQDAPSYRATLRKIRDAVAAKPDAEPKDPDAASLLGAARQAAAAVTGWENVVYQGQPLAFSLENAITLCRGLPWVGDQIAFFRDRRANFFKG